MQRLEILVVNAPGSVPEEDVKWVDYNDENPSRCPQHGTYESYVRTEGVSRAMRRYRRLAQAGELGPVLQELALRPQHRRRRLPE